MFDEDALQPAHSWAQASDLGPDHQGPPAEDDDGDAQSDPGGDSDVTPDPARNPEGRTLTG